VIRIEVDRDVCQIHGQCAYVAPDLFWFEGDDLRYDPYPAPELRDAASEAAEACPEQAIVLAEVDP